MRNVFKREQWNRKDQVYQSDAYCPSIEKVFFLNKICKALFKQHKLQQLLAQNQLKKLGLQTAQALIKALYEQVKRLEMQNFQYRSEMKEMYREYAQKQKQFQKQINFMRHKNNSVNLQRQRKFSQSKEYLSNMLMPGISRRLPVIPQSFNSNSTNSVNKNRGTSPIQKMRIIQTVSKQYVDMRDYRNENNSKQLYEQARDYFLSQQLQKVLIDFEDMSDVIREQKEQLNLYKEQYFQSHMQVQQISKQFSNDCNDINTTSTKPNYSTHTQKYTDQNNNFDISINKKLIIKGKRLFSTQNDNNTQTILTTQRVQFSPFVQGKVNKKDQQNRKQQQQRLSYIEIIKQYEHIIQQYKEYSAYLKAYLCSCIGFISKQTEESQSFHNLVKIQQHKQSSYKNDKSSSTETSRNLLQFPSKKIFNFVLNNVLQTVKQKVEFQQEIRKQVQKQNQQLKFILDQLISNLKLTGFPVMKDKKYYHHNYCQQNQSQQMVRNTERNRKQNSKINGQRNSRMKDHKININKPIIHRMTITQANNYYHPVK